jgi:DNA-binding MarR family transcriptional regulator
MSTQHPDPSQLYPLPDLLAHFNPKVQGIDYGVLDQLVGYSVRRVQILQYEHFVNTLSQWGITPPRFSALVIIARNPGLKLTVLSHVLGIARSGAVVLVDALEAMNLVKRIPSPTDRRALGLELTPKGQLDVHAISEAVMLHDAEVIKALNESEQRQLKTLLDKIIQSRAAG